MKRTDVYLVLDQSASMVGQKCETQRKMAWDLIKEFAAAEQEGDQEYRVTLVGFGSYVFPVAPAKPARYFTRPEVDVLKAGNHNTALRDGICAAFNRALSSTDIPEAVLVSIFSDGEENNSGNRAEDVKRVMSCLSGRTGLTVTFAGPLSAYRQLANVGIPEGNFKAWDGSLKEMAETVQATTMSTQTYVKERAKGVTRSVSFYVDPSKLSTPGIRAMAKKVTPAEVKTVSSRMDGRAIADFFKKFEPGRHYYQLLKGEYIDEDKDLVVHIKDKDEYRQGSRTVRMLLGLPETGRIRVRPAKPTADQLGRPVEPNYEIFVQSASVNRKLVEGQKLLTL